MKDSTALILVKASVFIILFGSLSLGIYLYNNKGSNDEQAKRNKNRGTTIIIASSVLIGIVLLLYLFFSAPNFLIH